MRPTSPDGAPLIGGVPGVRGLYAATGHGPWGILWAPLTGKVVAELLLDQPPSISLQRFSLRRFDTPTHRGLMRYRGRRRGDEPVGEQWGGASR